jgi:hypothetical protein
VNTVAKAALASVGILICGHAIAQEATFKKRGASVAVQKRDSGQCWRLARNSRLTEEQATQNVVTGYLIGGVIGVLIASSENEQANTDPKSTFRRQLHDECMVKRGYRKAE